MKATALPVTRFLLCKGSVRTLSADSATHRSAVVPSVPRTCIRALPRITARIRVLARCTGVVPEVYCSYAVAEMILLSASVDSRIVCLNKYLDGLIGYQLHAKLWLRLDASTQLMSSIDPLYPRMTIGSA